MMARYITATEEHGPEPVHFEHCVAHGVGYGQLWFAGRFHLEFTKQGLEELAHEAAELAAHL